MEWIVRPCGIGNLKIQQVSPQFHSWSVRIRSQQPVFRCECEKKTASFKGEVIDDFNGYPKRFRTTLSHPISRNATGYIMELIGFPIGFIIEKNSNKQRAGQLIDRDTSWWSQVVLLKLLKKICLVEDKQQSGDDEATRLWVSGKRGLWDHDGPWAILVIFLQHGSWWKSTASQSTAKVEIPGRHRTTKHRFRRKKKLKNA